MRSGNSSRMATSACSIAAMIQSTAGLASLDVRDRGRLSFAAQSIFSLRHRPRILHRRPRTTRLIPARHYFIMCFLLRSSYGVLRMFGENGQLSELFRGFFPRVAPGVAAPGTLLVTSNNRSRASEMEGRMFIEKIE